MEDLMNKVKVAVNGFGTVGKRIADAVSLQKDMELIGIAKMHLDFQAQIAINKGYKVYLSDSEYKNKSKETGIEVSGYLEDMLDETDIIIDCTPKRISYFMKRQGLKQFGKAGKSTK